MTGADPQRQIIDGVVAETRGDPRRALEAHRGAAHRDVDVLKIDEGGRGGHVAQRARERRAEVDGAGNGVGQRAGGERERLDVEPAHDGGAAEGIGRARLDVGLHPRAQLGPEGRDRGRAVHELPAHIGRAGEVAEPAAGRDGQRARASRRIERAGAGVADVHGDRLHSGVEHGPRPGQTAPCDRRVVGVGLVVHASRHAQISGSLIEHQALDAELGADQPRLAGERADRLRVVGHRRGLQTQRHVGHDGRAADGAGHLHRAGQSRHLGPGRQELRQRVDAGLEGALEPARRHPHGDVTAQARTGRLEGKGGRPERVFVVDDVGLRRGPRAVRQHEVGGLDRPGHDRACQRAAHGEVAVRRALESLERRRQPDARAPRRGDGGPDVGDVEGDRAGERRRGHVAAGLPLQRAGGAAAVEHAMVVAHEPPLVLQPRVPGAVESDAVGTRQRRAAAGRVQAQRRGPPVAAERHRALFPRGHADRILVVERQRHVEVEVAVGAGQVGAAGLAEAVDEASVEDAAAGRAGLGRRGDGQRLDERLRRGQGEHAGQRQVRHAGDGHRLGGEIGAQLVAAERTFEGALEGARPGHRHRRRGPLRNGAEIEATGQGESETDIVEHAVDAAVGHDVRFGERHGELLQRDVRAVEGHPPGDGAAGRRALADSDCDRGSGDRAAGAGEDADVTLAEIGAKTAHVDVDPAGAVLVVDVEAAHLQTANVEPPRALGGRVARRRRQVDEHAVLAHQQYPAVVHLQIGEPDGAAQDDPRQDGGDALGREERQVGVAGGRQADVVDPDPASEEVVGERTGGQVELPTFGHLPHQPVAAPTGGRGRVDNQKRCPDERHQSGDRPGEAAWDPRPHRPIIRGVSPGQTAGLQTMLIPSRREQTWVYASG